MCQTAIATIGTSAILSEVDWLMVISASILAGLLSLLNSVATGLPEVDDYGLYCRDDDRWDYGNI